MSHLINIWRISELLRKGSLRKVGKIMQWLMSGDVAALIPHLQLSLRLRGVVPRPEISLSRFALAEASDVIADSRNGPIRLLFFSHNLSHEGASISLKELACGLANRHSVAAKVIAFEDGPLRADYESCGIPVQVLPSFLHKISTPKRLHKEVERLALLIQTSESDVVFVNTLLNFPAILAAELAGLPSVWNPRESEPWDSYFRFLPNLVAQTAIAAIGLPRKVVFVARSTRAVWADFDNSGNFLVIHNSLNQERFTNYLGGDKVAARDKLGWVEDEVVFLCVGTLCDRKGQADALMALESITDRLAASIRIVFAGDTSGHYARDVRRLALRISKKNKIRIDFVDATESIGKYYLAANVFLLCSRVESYPRVILEAMAFGLPIISTPVFGVAEQLPDPDDALFYEPGNSEALGTHMLELAASAASRSSLGASARARFSEMQSFEQMITTYEKVLRTI